MDESFALTAQSQDVLSSLTGSQLLTDREAYDYLLTRLPIRTFSQTLSYFYQGQDLKRDLVIALDQLNPSSAHESNTRKVHDWLSDKYAPTDREDYIKLCYALKLHADQAQAFMALTTDGRFHLRNPKELTQLFGLRMGWTYDHTMAFYASLPQQEQFSPAKSDLPLTRNVADAFENARDEASFREIFLQQLPALGRMHSTAYIWFMQRLNLLISPPAPYQRDALDDEADAPYSINQIMDTYLQMKVPIGKETLQFDILQKTIKRYWPNATMLFAMRNREEDVTRRVIVLLYLITQDIDDPEDELTPQERFFEHYWTLNNYLNSFGLSPLDPRNMFDWLVLYSMKTNEERNEEAPGADQRLTDMIMLIFD
jgi:hypothetical protein